MKTLKQQFIYAVDYNFHPKTNKHSYKNCGYKTIKIVSYSYRKGLINFGCNISNFLKEEYGIRFLKEIKEEHIQSFFESKSHNSYATLRQYKSYLNIFDKLINQTYHIKIHFDKMEILITKGEKIRDATMVKEYLDTIISQNDFGNSDSILGLKICRLFGLRAEEVVSLKGKDFDLENGVLKVFNAKNNRYREIDFNTVQRLELAQEIRMEYDEEDRLVPIKTDSLNKYLSRKLQGLNIVEYKDKKTGIHSIRKMVAQEQHKLNIEKGYSVKKSYNNVSNQLGHGTKRDYFIEDSYIYPKKDKKEKD